MSDELTISAVPASTAVTLGCDCYVHRFGSIAPGRRARCCPSDMTDAESAEVRSAMPVPAWPLKQGGCPEAYRHRETLDAVRYLVDNGVKWMAPPVDFPYWRAVCDFFRRWRTHDYVCELHERLRRTARCLPLSDHAPHTKKPLLIEQGLPLPQRTKKITVRKARPSEKSRGSKAEAVIERRVTIEWV